MTQSLLQFSSDSTTQTLTSTTPIGCGAIAKFPDGTIQAGSDLTFVDFIVYIDLTNDTLNMGYYKLKMKVPIQNLFNMELYIQTVKLIFQVTSIPIGR